jgi:hypothetical protein
VLEPTRLFGRDLPLVISITAKAGTGSSGIYFKEHDWDTYPATIGLHIWDALILGLEVYERLSEVSLCCKVNGENAFICSLVTSIVLKCAFSANMPPLSSIYGKP